MQPDLDVGQIDVRLSRVGRSGHRQIDVEVSLGRDVYVDCEDCGIKYTYDEDDRMFAYLKSRI